jgi:hypothetical protein
VDESLPKMPREEKEARRPSFVEAPAVMTHGHGVQRFCEFGSGPSLPLAKTTTMLRRAGPSTRR